MSTTTAAPSRSQTGEASTEEPGEASPDVLALTEEDPEAQAAELARIKAENEALKQALSAFEGRFAKLPHVAAASSAAPSAAQPSTYSPVEVEGWTHVESEAASSSPQDLRKSLNTAEGTTAFLQRLQDHVDSPEFLATLEANRRTIFVQDSDQTDRVALLDLDDEDWWTVVPHPEELGTEIESDSLSGSYVIIEEDDVVAAVADFVALYLTMIPAAKRLSHTQLQAMLSGTFHELREKGTFGKLWDSGKLAYATYGWVASAYSLYSNPAFALSVARALFTVAKWTLYFVL